MGRRERKEPRATPECLDWNWVNKGYLSFGKDLAVEQDLKVAKEDGNTLLSHIPGQGEPHQGWPVLHALSPSVVLLSHL